MPVNYIDKLDTDQEQKASDLVDGHPSSVPQANGGMDIGVSDKLPLNMYVPMQALICGVIYRRF